ncbi:MAG: chemotaxis protein CheV [Synergistaceae bacterium]|nr:chemotaxis protein CheV [Synergistaceae bacterium]MBR0203466.1 chemotaxis protein CheV [Synergistaceae bacterium]
MEEKKTVAAASRKWEVVLFRLGIDTFAINVNKTKEILRWTGYRPVPTKTPAFIGITTVREATLPLIDLRIFLGIDSPVPLEQTKVMVVEFNDIKLGFLVDGVERIQQVNAEDLDASKMRGVSLKWVLYIIKRDERNILLLDYEAIIQETAPAVAEHMFDQNKLSGYQQEIGHVEDFHILVADDSPLLRQQTCDVLKQSGFTSIYPVKDGVEARKLLLDQGENFDLLISDIEMPLLDGLSLVETLRQDSKTQDMPVILFSSIMVKDLLDRAESLKIIHVLKPDVYKLVESVMKIYHDCKKNRRY